MTNKRSSVMNHGMLIGTYYINCSKFINVASTLIMLIPRHGNEITQAYLLGLYIQVYNGGNQGYVINVILNNK